MDRRLPRTAYVLAAALLAFPAGHVTAIHGVAGEEPPQLPPPPPTPSQTADRILGDAHGDVAELYEGPGGTLYRMMVDEASQAEEESVPRPLVVHRDGAGNASAGPDAAFWLAPPQVLGDDIWEPSPAAARTGNLGYAIATNDAGAYPLQSSSLFLTGAIDLATGQADANPLVLQPLVPGVNGVVNALIAGSLASAGSVYSAMFGDFEPRLTLAARHNLGHGGTQGRDGVALMVFRTQPTAPLASYQACVAPACTVLAPMAPLVGQGTAQPYQPVTAFGGSPGFSGATPWTNYTFNLRPFIGQTVWVGLYFAAMAAPTPTYFGGAAFSQTAGFYGFHMDDLLLATAGAHQNLQVRPLREPSVQALGQDRPTVAPEDPVRIRTHVRNTGYVTERAQVTVQVLADGGGVLAQRVLGPFRMPPGAVIPVDETFTGLPIGDATAVVSVRPAGDDPATPQNEAGDAPASAARLAAGTPDAASGDDQSSWPFRILRVRAIVPGDLVRSDGDARVGESVTFSLPLQNLGNVPETFTLEATLLDLDQPGVPVQDLLLPDQVLQTFTLGRGQSVVAQWELEGTLPGHYRLFVRDTRDDPFQPFDLDPDLLMPLRVPHVTPGPMLMNGALAEPAWASALQLPLAIRDARSWRANTQPTPANLPVLRAFHDGQFLYISLQGGPATTSLRVLFDDGDGRATDQAEDGILLPGNNDLHYRAEDDRFVPDAAPAEPNSMGSAAGIAEFRRELRSGRPQDLDLEGNVLRMFLEIVSTGTPVPTFHFPIGGEYIDGGITPDGASSHGLGMPDGSLDDEVATWWPVILDPPRPVVPGESRIPLRAISSGVGVELGPPPLLLENVSDCTPARGWTQQNVVTTVGGGTATQRFQEEPHTEKWNCGPVGPDARNVLFFGLAQDDATRCGGVRCDPYATLSNLQGAANFLGILTTPPVEVGDAAAPWLLLEHQVSAEAWACDGPFSSGRTVDGGSTGGPCSQPNVGALSIRSVARVIMDIFNPATGAWDTTVVMLPANGYSTEASTGIADPNRYGAVGRRPVSPAPASEVCPRLGATVLSCGWWDPAGYMPSYRPQNETVVVGAGFTGSPWRVDRIPLFGFHGLAGTTPVDVQGRTIRLNFVYVRPQFEPLPDTPGQPPFDLGWRIGTVAVLEEPRFQRDVAVADVRVGTAAFDPARLGLGPDAAVPIAVTVRNEGLREARGLSVRAKAVDALDDAAAPLCTSAATEVEAILPSLAELNLTFSCHLPDVPGRAVRLVAEVVAEEGDEFPGNNVGRDPRAYTVRRHPDLAVRVDATPRVASQAAGRDVSILLENRGNVPLTGFELTRDVFERIGTQGGDLLGEHARRWRIDGTIPVGGALRLDDEALDADPPVVPARDRAFMPPAPGTFDVVARVQLPGDLDASNDADQVTLRALREAYAETLDAPPIADALMVQGSWEPDDDGIWAVADGSDRHGRRFLAGDAGTGEIKANSDAVLELPSFDLAPLRGATLTFNHRFDLEEQFDAGRVEASVDGGATWLPLPPRPQPIGGLPAGYSSAAVLGPSPLADGLQAKPAAAFTGSSGALDGAAPDGFIAAEFDLASHPDLRYPTGIDRFRFTEMASQPLAAPVPHPNSHDLQYRHPTWVLPETNAAANLRNWWIDNGTVDVLPVSGDTMWWSGSAGPSSSRRPTQAVCTALQAPVDVPVRPGGLSVLQWWDWRSGWQEDEFRSGIGGQFAVQLRLPDSDGDALSDVFETTVIGSRPDVPDTDGDGWTDGLEHFFRTRLPNLGATGAHPLLAAERPDQGFDMDGLDNAWEINFFATKFGSPANALNALPSVDDDGDGLTNLVEQSWYTNPILADTDSDGLPDGDELRLGTNPRDPMPVRLAQARPDGWSLREVDLGLHAGERLDVLFTYTSRVTPLSNDPVAVTNLGWFIDDVVATSYAFDAATGVRSAPATLVPLQHMEDLDLVDGQAGMWRTSVTVPDACTATTWTLAGRTAARQPGGWHVAHGVAVPGEGETSVWRFAADNEQGYPHLADARLVSPLVDLSQVAGLSATLRFNHRYGFEAVPRAVAGDPRGAYQRAIDGGAVEFQLFDELTGTFGPWQQLFRGHRNAPDRILFDSTLTSVTGQPQRNHPSQLTADQPLPGTLGNRDKLAASGYTAIEERGVNLLYGIPGAMGDYFAVPPTRVTVGHGYSFESFPGLMRSQQGPWDAFPVSYVFAGRSQGVDGWSEEAWDITPLIGKRVRFGFHAQSNPSFTNADGEGRMHGWSIAGVTVEGEVFTGRPVQLRLRVATDGSVTGGAWEVDDVRVVGTPFTRNLAVVASQRSLVALPGAPATLPLEVRNLGNTPRAGLALAVRAVDQDKQALDDVEVDLGIPLQRVTGGLPPSLRDAAVFGPFSLAAVRQAGSTLAGEVTVDLPADPGDVRVQAILLEASGDPAAPWRVPDNQVTGAVETSWSIHAGVAEDLRAVPPVPTRSGLVDVEPGQPLPGQAVHLQALVENHGTTRPDVTARWRVVEVLRKGASPSREGVQPEQLGDWEDGETQAFGELAPGGAAMSNLTVTPPRSGLYRATVRFLADGEVARTESAEFFVGPGGTYYAADFGDPAEAATWQDNGQSPPDVRWRAVDGRLAWGVTAAQLQAGTTYCTTPNTRPACMTTNQNTPGNAANAPTFRGMEAIAAGPLVHLTKVPQGRAFLTLVHAHGFEVDDGGQVEVLPLVTPADPANPQPAFTCGGQPAWFILDPETTMSGLARSLGWSSGTGGTPPRSFTMPNRINPLAPSPNLPQPVIGGPPVEAEALRFDLSQPARSTCAGLPDASLANHTIQLRLHAGTRPGSQGLPTANGPTDLRRGSLGWQVQAMRISSADLDVAPLERTVPILDGAPKRFALEITNRGAVTDAFTLAFDETASTVADPGWIRLPADPVELAPGERRVVPFTVAIPADPSLSRGSYVAAIAVASQRDPAVRQVATLDLALNGNPLPDLSLQLTLEKGGPMPAFQAGTIAPVHATVFNVGEVASRGTSLRLRALNANGTYERVIGTVQLPPLCPLSECGRSGSSASRTFEWPVPADVGVYDVIAEVDPDERLVEISRANNMRLLVTRAVPLERADLRIDGLRILGTGPDGYAEEGALVQVQANVTNVGNAPAEGVLVRLIAGSSELSEETIPLLNPGQTRTVSAYRAASAGETRFSAHVLLPSGLETDIENNQVSRLLLTRNHDLGLVPSVAQVSVPAGGTTSFEAVVHNRGNAVERVLVQPSGANATGWALAVHPNPIVVPPNGTATALFVLRAPDDAVAGRQALRFVAFPAGTPAAKANATVLADVPVRAGAPTLTVDNLTTPPGEARLPFRLQATANAVQRVTVTLRGPDWEATPTVADLAANGNLSSHLEVRIPATIPPGVHAVELVARADGAILTAARAWVTVTPLRAVEVNWAAAEPGPESLGARQVVYWLLARNTGNLPVHVRAVPRDLADGQEALEAATTQRLAPGEQARLPLSVRLRSDAASSPNGAVDVWIQGEEVAAQRAATLEFPDPASAPNLVMERVDVTPRSGLVAGRSVRLLARVANHGSAASPPTQLSVYSDGALLQDAQLPAIEPGESATVELGWHASRSGTRLVTLFADGWHDVLESSEDDNGASVELAIGKGGLDDRLRAVPGPSLALLACAMAALAAALRRRGGPA